MSTKAPRLQMHGISKSFAGVPALQDVEFALGAGEVGILLGENGAGKSTLMKILTGVYTADAGEIRLDGQAVIVDTPRRARDRGIRMVFQELNLAPHLTVAENIVLGQEPVTAGGAVLDRRAATQAARRILERHAFPLDPDALVTRLSPAQRQLVEISKALYSGEGGSPTRVLILDEPTSSLNEREIAELLQTLRRLKQTGLAIVFISHRLEECFAIGDTITVLRDGHNVFHSPITRTDTATVVRAMVGRELSEFYPKAIVTRGDVRLSAEGLSYPGVLAGVSLAVRAGEIVGIAGLLGSGRTLLAHCLFGAVPRSAGTVRVDGQALPARHGPTRSIAAGMGYVTEDRKGTGLALNLPVRENITLAALWKVLWRIAGAGILRPRAERRAATEMAARLRVRAASVEQPVNLLSGGNQQKSILARWLFAGTKVLLLDEPTRGIDVGSKTEVYQLMGDLARQGVAMLLISSELPELLALSDRILVLHDGRFVADLDARTADAHDILHRTMTGRAAGAG